MFLINLQQTDPFFNLAVDEFLLKETNNDYFILGSNSRSVIIGKHQVAHKEINTKFISDNSIPVIRRISGGGTVYHDEGNINFSFITRSTKGKQVDFRKYTTPVIEFLARYGVRAQFEGKSDIRVNGMKISGNAEHVYRERVLHHGTILVNANLLFLKNSIMGNKSAYTTRGIDSNPAKVVNLRDLNVKNTETESFRNEFINFFTEKKENKTINLSDEEIIRISNLAKTKYYTWEWNYGYGPDYQFNTTFILNGEMVSVSMDVKGGIIESCRIRGSAKANLLADKFTGQKHMPDNIKAILAEENSFSDLDPFIFF